MGQASKASFDNNQPGLDYSEEMLLLMRSMHSMMQAREEREASILRSSPGPAHPASTPVTSQLTSNIQGNSSLVAHISSGNLSVESLGVTEDHTIQPSTPAEFSTLPRAESVLEESLGVDEGSHGVSAHPSPQIQVATATESTSTHQAGVHTARAPDQPNNALPVQASDLAGQGAKNGPFKAHRFGLKKDHATRDPLAASYDYTLKYPEDERYHELDEEARVWRVYGDEAAAFDNDMVGELSDSLDILLVFAGLFSAVLTTFVAQTSQSLSQDYTQLSASYLSELTMLIRANTNSTAISDIPLTSTTFSPAILDLWVNGLWFTSLVISLSVALFAVLAKQWLRQYMSIITGTPWEQACIRQFRFDGLEKWQVQPFIGMLPTFLHIALILFLAGLVIFLIPLSTTMAYIVGSISVTVVVLYLTVTVLPLFAVQCSYRTTLTHLLYSHILYKFSWRIYIIIISAYHSVWNQPNVQPASFRHMGPEAESTLKQRERFAAFRHQNQNLASLTWLGHYSSNPSAKHVLFWSFGAFPPNMSEKLPIWDTKDELDAFSQIVEHLRTLTNLDEMEGWFRTGIHLRFKLKDHLPLLHKIYVNMISDHNCDIISALSALAFGLSPVKFFHAGQCIELTTENALNWVLDTYNDGPPLELPALVWEPLLQTSGYWERIPGYFWKFYYLTPTVSSARIQKFIIFEPARSGLPRRTPLPNS